MNIKNLKNFSGTIERKINKENFVKWKFEDIAQNINEKITPKKSNLKTYIGLEHLDSGTTKIKRFGDTAALKGDKLKIYKNDIIFAKRNAYLKRIGVAEFDSIASAHSLVLRAKAKNIEPKFLPFFLLSNKFWDKAIEISVGSLSPTINWKILAKQEFSLPEKKIQTDLIELFESLENILKTKDQFRKKIHDFLYSMTDEIIKSSKKRVKINECIVNKINEKALPNQSPYVEIGDINLFNKLIKIKEKKSLTGSLKAKKGSTIVSNVRPNRGAISLLKSDYIVSGGFTILNPNTKIISKDFLFFILAWNKEFNYKMQRLSTGTTYPTITDYDVRNYSIPSFDINKQNKICTKFITFYNLLLSTEDLIKKTQFLKETIIENVFI